MTQPLVSPFHFLEWFEARVGVADLPEPPPGGRGRPRRVTTRQLIATLVFQVLYGVGTVRDHMQLLFQTPWADSSAAERRAHLPRETFTAVLTRVWQPLAQPEEPEAFWRGLRVVAIDGTSFSVPHTPQIAPRVRKARTPQGPAAFAKITTAVLLEVGHHNPLAAAIGADGASEWALAQTLIPQLPPQSLVLGDRLYGVAAFAAPLHAACVATGSQFLLRAGRATRPQHVARLADGSRLVSLAVRARTRPATRVDRLTVREIRVQVARPGGAPHVLCLWTSLLDPVTAPALDVAALYARRWEQELYFRTVKRVLRRTALLHSHTLETAAQEIAALLLASAALAAARQRGTLPPEGAARVSLQNVLEFCVKPMWLAVQLTQGVVTEAQRQEILARGYAHIAHYLSPPRRARSVPRQVRPPQRPWPRTRTTTSVTGPVELTLLTEPE